MYSARRVVARGLSACLRLERWEIVQLLRAVQAAAKHLGEADRESDKLPLMTDIARTTEPCVVRQTHRPISLLNQQHHVVDVAWQQIWQPPQPWPFPGTDPWGRGVLWDARTIVACPTCHENIYVWATRLLSHVQPGVTVDDLVAAVHAQYPRQHPTELAWARLGLDRWVEAGGDLTALV